MVNSVSSLADTRMSSGNRKRFLKGNKLLFIGSLFLIYIQVIRNEYKMNKEDVEGQEHRPIESR